MKLSLLVCLLISSVFAADDSFYRFQDQLNYTQEKFLIYGQKSSYSLTTHFYKNSSTKLMIEIHGYLDNCGYMKYINQYLWKKEYSILCIELPGHGLSSGKKADIDSFKTYEKIIESIPIKYFTQFSEVSFLAHSTGTTPLLMHVMNNHSHPFKHVILLAPLIRTVLWYPAIIFHSVAKYAINTVPRRSKDADKHKKFLEIANIDPHYIDFNSLHWFSELRTWNNELEEFDKKIQTQINVIFSGEDEVVDTDYNMMFYAEHFPNARIHYMSRAMHHMDLDSNEIQREFFLILDKILK